ncbi:hypothetical protein J2W35_004960 [Variovorax boronicumulans]|uniref:hypothetical protein n=1 Tax=Variovorax boronicumulans TaxID=436515 RepID=UPI00278585A7|nr:hypothetical protein [Variovorax boronicumulans]MDQ0084591.1 hypothetical protein [Variovorax boronicumulans]
MDLSKLSDADLQAMQSGDMSKVSDDGLRVLSGEPPSLMKSFVNGIPKGIAGLADNFNNLPENMMNLSRMISGSIVTAAGHPEYAVDVKPPTNAAHDILTNIGAIRPAAEPTTMGGRVVDMMGQSVGGGGINPVSIAKSASRGAWVPIVRDVTAALASGAGAGMGLEAAKKVDTGSETGNAALQTAATMAAGALPGAFLAARGSAGDRTAAALNGVTPEQLAMADALLKKSVAAGSPLTGYEAIQAVTGLNPKMQTQQRVTEQSDAAARNLTPMMQARPGRNAELANAAFDQIAPVNPRPDALAGRLMDTAKQAITNARQAGNAQAKPYYDATTGNPNARITSNDWNTLTADPLVQKALGAVKNDPVYGVTNEAPGSVAWLDAAKKWMDDKGGAARLAGENNAARMYTGATGKVMPPIDAQFPDYATARAIVAKNMQDVVTPMDQGQVGKLSRSDDFKAQVDSFLPEKPLDVNPSVIRETVKTLSSVDPNITPEMLAQHLRSTFNESNGGGIRNNVMGGFNFAKKVADNPMQRENLIEALKASGKSPTPLTDSLDVFQAQGMKPNVNSATAANMAESSMLGGRKAVDFLMRPIRAIPGQADAWRNSLATKELADALASPDSVKRLQELARVNGTYSPLKQQMLVNLLMGQRAAQDANKPRVDVDLDLLNTEGR